MMKIYQIDAFTDRLFSGNPAAVCPLDDMWLDDSLMQNIAAENNLAETAFYIKDAEGYHIRWFTPTVEVDLCGHATLAAGFALFNLEGYKGERIDFASRSGMLTVKKSKEYLSLDFPADALHRADMKDQFKACFNEIPREVYRGKSDYLFVYDSEKQIREIRADLATIRTLPSRGVIVTAAGEETDFVSRFFAPQSGIDEDPVTGSAHTTLTPFWSERLKKADMSAAQLSQRGGFLFCRNLGERVEIAGQAVLYMTGQVDART